PHSPARRRLLRHSGRPRTAGPIGGNSQEAAPRSRRRCRPRRRIWPRRRGNSADLVRERRRDPSPPTRPAPGRTENHIIMTLVQVDTGLQRELESRIEGEVRFDAISRALYSTDASVYQIQPVGVVVAKNRQDILTALDICRRYRCPLTMRGGGTSQGGQAIG